MDYVSNILVIPSRTPSFINLCSLNMMINKLYDIEQQIECSLKMVSYYNPGPGPWFYHSDYGNISFPIGEIHKN